MDDFVAHIDRRLIAIERTLDDIDRPHDSGAEATRLGQEDLYPGRILGNRWWSGLQGYGHETSVIVILHAGPVLPHAAPC
jgi:hypothetical protein